ncbi:MAG: L,D-transpeptidase family protein [bacterium]
MSFDAVIVSGSGGRFRGRRFACVVGRSGITRDKREGDGATPAGTHRIVGMFYRPDRISATAVPDWAIPIRIGDLWSDDPRDPAYNLPVRFPHPFSHEQLRRPDPLYDLVLVTDWNHPAAVPGLGSAIFLHRWRRACVPTAGCVAFAPADLAWIARHVELGTRLIVKG